MRHDLALQAGGGPAGPAAVLALIRLLKKGGHETHAQLTALEASASMVLMVVPQAASLLHATCTLAGNHTEKAWTKLHAAVALVLQTARAGLHHTGPLGSFNSSLQLVLEQKATQAEHSAKVEKMLQHAQNVESEKGSGAQGLQQATTAPQTSTSVWFPQYEGWAGMAVYTKIPKFRYSQHCDCRKPQLQISTAVH